MNSPSIHIRSYAAPTLVELGPISKLTEMRIKKFGAADGFTYQGVPIGNASI